ncbi:MAG: PE-PPE domain-containing protein, partial [Mycobacterium sp.]
RAEWRGRNRIQRRPNPCNEQCEFGRRREWTGQPIATAIQTHIGMTTYYLIPTANLPLLDPLRLIPVLGNPHSLPDFRASFDRV